MLTNILNSTLVGDTNLHSNVESPMNAGMSSIVIHTNKIPEQLCNRLTALSAPFSFNFWNLHKIIPLLFLHCYPKSRTPHPHHSSQHPLWSDPPLNVSILASLPSSTCLLQTLVESSPFKAQCYASPWNPLSLPKSKPKWSPCFVSPLQGALIFYLVEMYWYFVLVNLWGPDLWRFQPSSFHWNTNLHPLLLALHDFLKFYYFASSNCDWFDEVWFLVIFELQKMR